MSSDLDHSFLASDYQERYDVDNWALKHILICNCYRQSAIYLTCMSTSKHYFLILVSASLANDRLAVVYYEWFLNLTEELQWVWKLRERRALASLVYILLRYPDIARLTLWAYCISPIRPTVCSSIEK